ncbi:hypothetical protein [Yersinia phage MHG19]|nr:hypothetical protein [Yersinia phage MHG19]
MKTSFSESTKGTIAGFMFGSSFLVYCVTLAVLGQIFGKWSAANPFSAAIIGLSSGLVWLLIGCIVYNLISYLMFRKAKQSIKEDQKAKSLSTFIEGCRNESL